MRKFLLLLCCLSLFSCGIYTYNDFMSLEKGATKQYVLDRYGNPSGRSFDKTGERLEYIRDDKTYILQFENNILVGFRTIINPNPPVATNRPYVNVNYNESNDSYNGYNGYNRYNRDYNTYYGRYRVMSNEEFNDFFNSFKKESFDSDKLKLLSTAAKYNNFTADQCIRLMNTYNFDSDKLKIIKIIGKKIVGGQSWKILDCFTFMSSKDEAKKYL